MYELETHTLDNGLRVHLAYGEGALVAVQAWVGVGAADDPPDRAGLAHLVEHLIFRSSGQTPPGELARSVERAGGEINAWTSLDHTVFHSVVPREAWPLAVEAMAGALVRPCFEPDDLELERAVVRQELAHGVNGDRALQQALFSTMFLSHPYRKSVLGTAVSVALVSTRDVAACYRTWYVGSNVDVVVAGAFDRADVLRHLALRFGALASGAVARAAPARFAGAEPRVAVVEHPSAEGLAVAFAAPPLRHGSLAALEVAAVALAQRAITGAGPSACYVRALRDASLFVLEAHPPSRALARGVAELAARARELAAGIGDDEVSRARVAIEVERERQLETVQGRARAIGWYAAMTRDASRERAHAERVRRLGRSEVRAALEQVIVPERSAIAALVPPTFRGRRVFAQAAPGRLRKALTAPRSPARVDERRERLPSGVTVLVRRDPGARLVSVRAAWPGGLRLEDEATNGLGALLARVLPRGCGKLGATAVARKLDELGGSMEGVAGRNSFAVAGEWLVESWREGLALLADCVQAPRLDAGEIDRARGELVAELAEQAQRPSKLASRAFLRALYGAHPYHRDVLGTEAALLRLGRKALREHHRDHLGPGELVLAVVGDVDPDEVIAQARALWAQAPAAAPRRAAIPPPVFVESKLAAQREVFVYHQAAQAHLVVGFPGAAVTSPERLALEVLAAALGGQGGRLFLELRERRAIAYQVAVHVDEGVDPGYLAIHVACAPERLDEAHAVIRAELGRVVNDGLTADELARARSYVVGAHEAAMQRRSAVAAAMAYHELYGLPWQAWRSFAEQVAALDPAALAAVARAHLRWDLAVTATVRPQAASPAAERRGKRVGHRRPAATAREGAPARRSKDQR